MLFSAVVPFMVQEPLIWCPKEREVSLKSLNRYVTELFMYLLMACQHLGAKNLHAQNSFNIH